MAMLDQLMGDRRAEWVARVEAESNEVNHPDTGTVSHAELFHKEEWWEAGTEGEAKHIAIYRKLRAQHQTVEAFVQASWRETQEHGYD